MKYCLNCMQKSEILDLADEIYIEEKNADLLTNVLEDYPKVPVLWEAPADADWQLLEAINSKHPDRIIVVSADPDVLKRMIDMGIARMYKYAVTTFYELRALKDLDVRFARIDGPLFFDMDRVKALGIPIRVTANTAYSNYLPHANGLHGTWIRPEDQIFYEDYVETIEFHTVGLDRLAREAVLFNVYKKGKWPDNLNILISHLDTHIDNRYVSQDRLMPIRLNCKQICEISPRCHICEHALNFGVTVKKYHRNLQEPENDLTNE